MKFIIIIIQSGTSKGGLSSQFLFNLFYQNLIYKLNLERCGITIDGNNYNVL